MNLKWMSVQTGPLTKADWRNLLDAEQYVDPYLVWADLTKLSGYDHAMVSGEKWPILLELTRKEGSLPDAQGLQRCGPDESCHPALGYLDIPGAYKRVDDKTKPTRVVQRSSFITASVSVTCIPELYRCGELIKRFQLGLPRIPRVSESARPDGDGIGVEFNRVPRVVVGVIDDGFAFAHTMFRHPSSGKPRTAFLWDQNDSVCHDRERPWRRLKEDDNDEFGYGAELHRVDIQESLREARQGESAASLQELKVYQLLDYVPRRPTLDEQALRVKGTSPYRTDVPLGTLRDSSHGTAVAAMAAGSRLTLPTIHHAQGQWPTASTDQDHSGNWPLVLVQLPARTTLDSSGGSLGVHILDGLRYIVRRAQSLPYRDQQSDKKLASTAPAQDAAKGESEGVADVQAAGSRSGYIKNKIVVNISYGAVAGPHDGTSIIEEAIADLVKETGNLWVVLAAGNAHGSKTHCRLELKECGPAKHMTWTVGPDNLLESYLEIWFPDCDSLDKLLDPAWLDNLMIEVTPPAGLAPLKMLKRGQGHFLATDEHALPVASALFARKVAQGTRGTMLLLTCSRTRRPLGASWPAGKPEPPVAPHGRWQIKLRWGLGQARSDRKLVVHAWAERNDQLWGHGRRQQSTVVGEDPIPDKTEYSPSVREFSNRGALRAYTDDVPRPFQAELSGGSLSHVPDSTHKFQQGGSAVVVGGRRLSDGEMARYSGAGATRSSPVDRGRLPGGDSARQPPDTESRIDDMHPGKVRSGGPDVGAPSDAGIALKGLRTIGMREGSVARLGGTSAAAPLVTRFIADYLYKVHVLKEKPDPDFDCQELKILEPKHDPAASMDGNSRRATGMPRRDDRLHRGRISLDPRRR